VLNLVPFGFAWACGELKFRFSWVRGPCVVEVQFVISSRVEFVWFGKSLLRGLRRTYYMSSALSVLFKRSKVGMNFT